MAEDPTNTNAEVSGAGGSSNPLRFAAPSNGGASKVQQPPPKSISTPDIEEAHIIEETVIKPARVRETAPTPAVPQAPQSTPAQPSVPTASPPRPPQPPPTSPKLQPVPLDQPPAPATTPEPPPQTQAPNVPAEQERISTILAETKLPERRDPVAPDQQPSGQRFDTTLGASIDALVAETTHEPEPASPTTQQEERSSSIVSPMRTLKNDLQGVVRDSKMSLVRAVALEQEKRHGQPTADAAPSKSRSSFIQKSIIAIVALGIVGGGALFGISFLTQQQTESTLDVGSSILFVENTALLPLEGNSALDIKRLVAGARLSGGGTLGSITRYVPIFANTSSEVEVPTRPVALETFLNLIGAQAPEELVRALSEEFFFGIHTVDENAPLLVIPVLSYERAFAGMLAWEETINNDLAPAFTLVPTQVLGTSGLPEKRRFEDVVMRNYDVRALRDDTDEIQLYYSFPTRSILVIGESPYSFTEILNRLRAEGKL